MPGTFECGTEETAKTLEKVTLIWKLSNLSMNYNLLYQNSHTDGV